MDSLAPGLSHSLHQRLLTQRTAFEQAPWPDAAERRTALRRLREVLLAAKPELFEALSNDFGGRGWQEIQLLELFPAVEALRHAERHVARWMRDERRRTGLWHLPGRNRVVKQPLGVVGVIVPWNLPLYLSVGPLASALAAGNRVMLKLSEFTPTFSDRFQKLIADTFPPEQVTVIAGGADVAADFASLPFDHLLFTGSTEVGRKVMAAASANLTPVTLELGGKSPALVGPECSATLAAQRLVYGKCANAGQICVAPDYVLLPRGMEQAFAEAAAAEVMRRYPSLLDNPDYASVINGHHVARLQGLLEDALAKGARAMPLHPEQDVARRRLSPTLLFDVRDDMRVMQEEIFGPWLPVVPYDRLEDAIRYVNARPRPLALYYMGNDRRHQEQVLRQTHAGGVTFNEVALHVAQDDLPFGGIGGSGMGHYHGREGFLTFSKVKPVHQVYPPLVALDLLKPPFGKRFEAVMRWMLR